MFRKLMTTLAVSLGLIALVGSPALATTTSPAACGGAETTTASVVYTISGMTCGSCSGKVQAAVEAVTGVAAVAVDLEAGTATVIWSGHADDAAVISAVKSAGFTASVKKAGDKAKG